MKAHIILGVAALNGLVVTALAAMGAHALTFAGNDKALFEQATDFHYIHSLALGGCAMLSRWGVEKGAKYATYLFLLGILGFSVSLYWRAVMGPGSLGSFHWVTPLGGLSLMAGWLVMALAAFQYKDT